MSSKKMSSRPSMKILPLIFGISITFFSYSIASVRTNPEKDSTMAKTEYNGTRHASILNQSATNKDDFGVNFKSLDVDMTKSSEKHSVSDTRNRQSTENGGKYKRSAKNSNTQEASAGYNFLSSLFHRFSEITRNHNKMYNLRYKSNNVSQIHENTTANATRSPSPSALQTRSVHTIKSATTTTTAATTTTTTTSTSTSTTTPPTTKHANNSEASTTSRRRLQYGQSKTNETRNKKPMNSTLPPSPTGLAKNMSTSDTKDGPQKPCPKCKTNVLPEDEVVALRTTQFKDLLIDKLRLSKKDLSAKPSRGYPKLPRDILEKTLRDNARQEAIEEFYAQDKELILDGRDLGRKCIRSREVTGCFMFVLEGKVRGEVASAQLWLYKTPDGNDVSGQTIRVFQLEKTRSGRLRRRNLMIRQDTYVQEGWVTMNVTRSVRSWVGKRMQTAMMAIRCDTCRTRNQKALYGAKGGYRPLLIIDYDTSVSSTRKRRVVDDCDPRHECCKRNLELNFTNIGMPTILFPGSISVGYCFGYCNDSPEYRFNHTQLIQSARLNDPTLNATVRRQLQPCCIPLTFKDTFLLMFTSQGLIRTTVPNVIVKSCGCV